MIGIVIVSHSAKLAAGVLELAAQMTQGAVPLAAAGGIDDDDNPLGTDPLRVHAAIEAVYSDDGVLVLMDLGSALMSAEMALEFLTPQQREHVHLLAAPLVEGAIAAAVQASIGSPLATVIAESQNALAIKNDQLVPSTLNTPFPVVPPAETATWHKLELIVPNRLGLHARPAARLVRLAVSYDAVLYITKDEQQVDARSINQVIRLGARQGDHLTFYASGTQASALLSAIQSLADEHFGDDLTPDTPPSVMRSAVTVSDDVIMAIPAVRGLAIGQVQRLQYSDPVLDPSPLDDRNHEMATLASAINNALAELQALIHDTSLKAGGSQAAIFEAQRLMLQDPDLLAQVRDQITVQRLRAPYAWWTTIQGLADAYRQIDDSLLQERASDVLDMGRRVLTHIAPDALPRQPLRGILLADDLTPSDTAQLDREQVIGIVLAHGSTTSHSTIIARALGIPTVIGIGAAAQQIESGRQIALDGSTGQIWLNPHDEQLHELHQQQSQWQQQQMRFAADSQQPAIMHDGTPIEVAANIGTPAAAVSAASAGADGIGLFRTELMFMERDHAPDEDAQIAAYRQVADAMNGKPVIIRTLDVGGDKPLAYLPIMTDQNFINYRGIRNWLDMGDLARTQLRAILRASAVSPLRVMFPMISTLDELLAARALLDDVRTNLQHEGHRIASELEIGIMVEVPAAVMIADQLARYVDFFSIGTNDLTQYTMAAHRDNPHMHHLTDPLQPAVLQAIARTTQAAHDAGIWVGMCGEMAGDPLAVPLLVGLGLTELSMGQHVIAEVKALIRSLNVDETQALAQHILTLSSVNAVRAALTAFAEDRNA